MTDYTGKVYTGKKTNFAFSAAATLPANTYDSAVYTGGVAAALTLPALTAVPHSYKLQVANAATALVSLTITAAGTDLIGASGTLALTQNQSAAIMADRLAGKWQIVLGPL